MAASTLSAGGMIDPTKQAEYPIILGDRLAGKASSSRSKLINIRYNYKTKSATAQQRSVITRSPQSRDHYNLTITDKTPNTEQSVLTYSYQGSVDPAQSVSESEDHSLALVFDSNRKVFVLEPVTTQLNFNLRSAPAKTEKQVLQQYAQLRTLQEDDHVSSDDRASDNASANDDGPADDDNPYDYRHFLPKNKGHLDDDKSASGNATPDPYANTSKANTPLITAIKPTPSPRPRPYSQANPLRQKKQRPDTSRQLNAATAPSKTLHSIGVHEKPNASKKTLEEREKQRGEEMEEIVFESSKSSPSETGTGAASSQKTVSSPGSNIIIDGDLIIDMGSPPPTRPAFKVNPAHFTSTHTPANGDDDDDDDDNDDNDDEEEEEEEYIEALQLPSPLPTTQRLVPDSAVRSYEEDMDEGGQEEEDDDDALAAEMEAAFEEEALNHPPQTHIPMNQYAPSEDESEVSEEE